MTRNQSRRLQELLELEELGLLEFDEMVELNELEIMEEEDFMFAALEWERSKT